MEDEARTKKQLINELVELRQRVSDLEKLEGRRKSDEEELQLLQFSIDHAPDNIAWITPDARFIKVNEAACRSLGYTREELTSMRVFDLDPDFPEESWPALWEEMKKGGPVIFESRHRRKDGSIFPVEISASIMEINGKEYHLGIARNITKRKEAEGYILHLKEVLNAIRGVNQLIVKGQNPRQLLEDTCKILVQTRGYGLVWIGQVEVGTERVIPIAREGKRVDYLDKITVTCDESELGRGPTGNAIRMRRPAVCQDMATDPQFAPWREAALASGFASSAAMPMIHGERLFGALSIYADYPRTFNEEEICLLSELASNIAFALQSIEDDTERKHAEEKINASLREKDILLKEIHHRVKNNLQVISSLLDLQAASSRSPEVIEMFHKSQNRIRSMAMIHEKLYASEDFGRINLADYVISLSQELFQSYMVNPMKIDLTVRTGSDAYLDINKAIPCGLILNELIANALHHAFPENDSGEIKIKINVSENKEIEIIIHDNGLGIPDEVDIHQPGSVGLYLVNGLVKNQLYGQVEVRRDRGTEFRIKFPL